MVPPPPRARTALRSAVEDFYYNSWRFLGANIAVGALLLLTLLGTFGSLVTLAIVPLLGVPIAGIMRMATRLVRDGHTDFSDFTDAVRHPMRILVLSLAQSVILLVLVVDVIVASAWGSWLGTFFMVSALYGFLLLWAYAAIGWTLVLDPERGGESPRTALRLAFLVIIAHPVRMLAFLTAIGVLLLVATVLIAPLLTFAIGLLWLAIARYVLPVADRLEGRATAVIDDASAETSSMS